MAEPDHNVFTVSCKILLIDYWRPIVGYEGAYEVSVTGAVRNAKTGILLKCRKNEHGYRIADLKRTGHRIHRLVMATFHGPCPLGYEVHHKDSRKANNCFSNLEYVTASQNTLYAYRDGCIPRGELHHAAKLTAEKVRALRAEANTTAVKALARQYGIAPITVRKILKGIWWRHV